MKAGDLVRVLPPPTCTSRRGLSGWQKRVGLVLCKYYEADSDAAFKRQWWTVNFAGTIRVVSEAALEKAQ